MKFQRFILLLAGLALLGCAGTNPVLSPSYMGSQAINGVNYEQIHKQLTRSASQHSMGLVTNKMLMASVTPITAPLIIAQETENGKKQLRSDADTKKVIDENIKQLVNTKPCFWVMIQTSGDINNAQFKNWVGKVKTKSGELIDIEFDNVKGVQSVPSTRISAWNYNVFQWENFTGACAKSKFNSAEDFSVVLINTLMRDVENLEAKWTFSK